LVLKPNISTKVNSKDSNRILLNSVSSNQGLWIDFKAYLIAQKQSKSSIRNKVGYAQRFNYILESNEAHDLLKLSHGSKTHAMKALASLSKFLGKYDLWLDIIKKYQLKWAEGNKSMKVFKSIFDSESNGESLDKMINWIKDVSKILPQEYQNVLLFNTLTGLRPDEAQKTIYLIKTRENEYVDKDRGVLKHYQFPIQFLRRTKNAYISIINQNIINIAKHTPNRENYYNSLRKRISIINDFDMDMYYCRKVFATYLRNVGIEQEIIDLLQGRISNNVFVNHYYRSDINKIITRRIHPILDIMLQNIKK
jgi:intergrase/recombinase